MTSYHTWLSALLQYLHLPATSPLQAVSVFSFDGKPAVYVSARHGQIDMMSEAGTIAPPYASATLLSLLEHNRASGAEDALNISLARASGTVIVWSRQRQAALDAAGAARLIGRVRQRADALRALLESPVRQGQLHSPALERALRLGPPVRR